ncbi:MAG: hypothetical protein CHACPFDD_03963 [Phycisphaerae bacterium]|nr:hypothetical protein [Phycisphaerae bacterium]
MSADRPSPEPPFSSPPAALLVVRRGHVPLLLFFVSLAIALTVFAPRVWPVLGYEGVFVALVLLSAAGWGAWPASWFRGSHGIWEPCVALALGAGILGLLTLALGLAAALGTITAWSLIAAGAVAGLSRLARDAAGDNGRPLVALDGRRTSPDDAVTHVAARSVAWLVLLAPACVMLVGAAAPPGVLWPDEAGGYDALEYHLQCPREYYQAGRITFLPHNVYASFPQQVEILYLLLNHLLGGPLNAASAAQLLHAAFGALFVLVVYRAAPAGWPRVLTAVTAGSVPWLSYLGCLAYVELPMLYFAALAGLAAARAVRNSQRGDGCRRAFLLAGLMAGLASACKYTAIGLVTAGLSAAWLIAARGGLRLRLHGVSWILGGAVLSMSPWLVRNAWFTGNPVFPLAGAWLGGRDWSGQQAVQWSAAHALPPELRPLPARLATAWRELLGAPPGSGLFGVAIFVAAGVGIVGRCVIGWRATEAGVQPGAAEMQPGAAALHETDVETAWRLWAVWGVLMVLMWVSASHMPGRFVLPLVVALTFLAASAFSLPRPAAIAAAVVVVLLAAWSAGGNVARLRAVERARGIRVADWAGAAVAVAEHHWIARITPPDSNIWMVGDAAPFYVPRRLHYSVVFNRDPWIEYAAAADAPGAVAWLRERGVTHVLFAWSEIDRLRRTYGFSPIVTREWVAALETAGLRRVAAKPPAPAGMELFEVTH